MCGIYGLVAGDPVESGEAFERAAISALRHRGPDGEGRWRDARCRLGHLRLAIIDLSERASQPMVSASARTVIAFNGEIYNYLELRAAMDPPPGGWRTESDTEVLLELLERRGIEGLRDAIGMFAIAVWKPVERDLWLIRDRIGKKPLYYATTADGALRFASEMGALLADGRVPRRTTPDRLAEFLQHGYLGAPRTGLAEVSALPPGHWLKASVRSDGIRTEVAPYWELPEATPATDHRRWLEEFDGTLRDAVRIRLRSDVPIAAFLSGGVDSSVVCLLAQQQLGGTLRTHTIDFEEPEFSEGREAEEVARHLGTAHRTSLLRLGAGSDVRDVARIYGDLHGDSSALPTLEVCRLAREHATVILSGDGGDELLGGYTRYRSATAAVESASRWPRAVSATVAAGAAALPWWLRGAGALSRWCTDLGRHYALQVRAYGTRDWPPVLLRRLKAGWPDPVAAATERSRSRPPLLRLMASDVATYLPEDILVKVDRASMAVGLEARAPLLDHRLFELTMRANPRWLMDEVGAKVPLRTLYGPRLPTRVFTRRKMGFGVPLAQWFRGDLAGQAARSVLSAGSRIGRVVDAGAVRRLLWSHRTGQRDESLRIWHLMVLAAWLEEWAVDVDERSSPWNEGRGS